MAATEPTTWLVYRSHSPTLPKQQQRTGQKLLTSLAPTWTSWPRWPNTPTTWQTRAYTWPPWQKNSARSRGKSKPSRENYLTSTSRYSEWPRRNKWTDGALHTAGPIGLASMMDKVVFKNQRGKWQIQLPSTWWREACGASRQEHDS